MKIRIGSRGSKLALWQAHYTRDKLEAAGFEVEIKIIKTKGDQIQHLGFDKLEGKGFFTKEIEDALLAGEVDLAVHSCKDMPTDSPEGLVIAAYSSREAPNDVLLINSDAVNDREFLKLSKGAVVGTSSARRKAQLQSLRPDIELKDIRGNVPTRIRKIKEGDYDAILLAAAGLNRLQVELKEVLEGSLRIDLPCTMFIPAPAQGVLAYQIRSGDASMKEVVEILNDQASKRIAETERGILEAFQGGCQVPIGIYSEQIDDHLHTWVSQAESWNTVPRRMHFSSQEDIQVESILNAFIAEVNGSVFISTDLESEDIFRRHIEALNVTVNAQPLIAFRAMEFETDLSTLDWLFFSSKNAARYFFEHTKEIPGSIKIASINKGTAGELAKLGHPADFIGEGGSMEAIAAAFDRKTGQHILFPRASHSRRTIQMLLKEKEIEDVIVYDNFHVSQIDERKEDILVFTSPMNVDSYCSRYSIKDNQVAVAIGSSTAKAIRNAGHECTIAFEPTRWALVDVVTRNLCESI